MSATEARDLLRSAKTPVCRFCLHAATVDDIDFSGSFMLRVLTKELATHDVTFVLASVPEPAMAQLERDGLVELIGREHVFPGHVELFAAYDALPPQATAAPAPAAPAPATPA